MKNQTASPRSKLSQQFVWLAVFFLRLLVPGTVCAAPDQVPAPTSIVALNREWRVDLAWDQSTNSLSYQVQRAANPDGPFEMLPVTLTNVNVNVFSDFIGHAGTNLFYQVRGIHTSTNGQTISPWSKTVSARALDLNTNQMLTEMEEAGFHYFYDYAVIESGFARQGTATETWVCSIGATGFGMFNLVVGAERHFISRDAAADRALKTLRFLDQKTVRYHGAFAHLVDGVTGKTISFSEIDDGADLVETAFLMQGVLLWRQYFTGTDAKETEIRQVADKLWRGVEWDWFAGEEKGTHFLRWHWSPDHGWQENIRLTGFNEAQITYILALASPTHPISAQTYWQGWEVPSYGHARSHFGVALELGNDELGIPLFWTQYSYLGLDPHAIFFHDKSYFEHFQDVCREAELYADSRSNQFKGYGQLWGWTAGMGPDGYKVYEPGTNDDGTIIPGGTMAALPYAAQPVLDFMMAAYSKHGRKLWGPFGFYDAFNLSRDWFSKDYLADEVGPVAPMIENFRTGLCWRIFMETPEIAQALKKIEQRPANEN